MANKIYQVIEVNAGLCTGTLRSPVVEKAINVKAAQGWQFEHFETVIGRCCLIFPRYKMMIVFSKDSSLVSTSENTVIKSEIKKDEKVSDSSSENARTPEATIIENPNTTSGVKYTEKGDWICPMCKAPNSPNDKRCFCGYKRADLF